MDDDKKAALAGRSDELIEAARSVQELEREKRRHPISTPGFHDLADRIQERSREVFRIAAEEERLGEEIPTDRETIDSVEGRH